MAAVTETIVFRWQFCGGVDEDSAQEVRAWVGAHGDICLAVAVRTATGGWLLDCGDLWSPETADMDMLFNSARSAIEHLARLHGAALVEAVCRCGTDADCD
ncbi:hypothetical protein KIF24_24985 [Micromonospora sp. Llam7]|uniref:hypothetical protein n=1 Tax=Micromonospora tarapacensis TaxID=2835305 RepID=UPI001C83B01F|nr:hypothetical protein [Micromonospora tarapacensis]MBX7268965.1 hypothetical protein [Micromonospora tarapacensis]